MSLTVDFTDASTPGPSGPIAAWAWDFGDSNTSTSQNPSHTYAAGGTYTVSLTVTGTSPDGTANVTRSITVASGSSSSIQDDFVSYTARSRPSFTPTRSRTYSDAASFRAYISELAAGDELTPASGCGEILISSGSGTAFTIAKNPSGYAVIDLGVRTSVWGSTPASDYVRFTYTGSGNNTPFHINGCSKLRFYGGELDSGIGGTGMLVNAPTHDLIWFEGYITKCGGSGVSVRGTTSSGVSSTTKDIKLQFEVADWCMNPAYDNHADKGTGFHGCILHGNTGSICGTAQGDTEFIIYAHDSLAPGATSAGHTWPEGGGGSVIEQGNSSGGSYDNVDLYAYGKSNLMIPNATNPGSTGSGQTGGNVLNNWGNIKLNGGRAWLWGDDISGSMLHSDNGSWHPGSPVFTVEHGRGNNTNQSTAGSNISQRYPTKTPSGASLGITYTDCA